jgi:hypothetical protein
MKFEDLPFNEKVRVWFGPDPVTQITESLARFRDAPPGLHGGAYIEPGEPLVGVEFSPKEHGTASWVRFHMLHAGAAYIEERDVDHWTYSRIAQEARVWRQAVQHGDKETQRILPAAD